MVREAQPGSILTRRSVRRLSPNTGNVLDFWPPRHEAEEVASATMEVEMDQGLLPCLEDITHAYLTSLWRTGMFRCAVSHHKDIFHGLMEIHINSPSN